MGRRLVRKFQRSRGVFCRDDQREIGRLFIKFYLAQFGDAAVFQQAADKQRGVNLLPVTAAKIFSILPVSLGRFSDLRS